jgi:uncharacterized RDD family membrane protein YckC
VSHNYPTLSQRVLSTVVDQVVILAFMLVIAAALDAVHPPDWIRVALFFGIWGVYEPVFMTRGCTLGNYVIGLRARQFQDDSKRINITQAYIRYIVKVLFGWLSFLTINMNKQRRAIHDLAASTVMIKV